MSAPYLHEIALGLLIVASTISILIIVARALTKEFEALALDWIRTLRRIQAEWRKPLTVEQSSEPSQMLPRRRSDNARGS